MTITLNEKKVKALKLARKRIEQRKSSYICYALNHAPRYLEDAADQVRTEIMQRLTPHATVQNWIIKNVPEASDLWINSEGNEWHNQCRKYRIRWINALILEYGGTP